MREGKLSKGRVHYRVRAERSGQRCGNCSMFTAQPHAHIGKCSLVEGEIDPDYVCDRWEPKR